MSTESLAQACAGTRVILAGVRPEQFGAPTPCASWDVRALINHFVGTPRWAAATVESGSDVPVAGEDYAAGDFLAGYDETVRAALDAFGSAGALKRPVKLSFGEFPGATLLGIVTMEQFTHG